MSAEAPTIRIAVDGPTRAARESRNTPGRLTIPARPAGLAAVNATTIIGSAAVAIGGPIGWLAGGAAVLGGAALVRRGVRRGVRRRARAAQQSHAGAETTRATGGGTRRGALGRLLGGGRSAGSGRSTAGHPTGSGSGRGTGAGRGAGTGAGKRGSLLGRGGSRAAAGKSGPGEPGGKAGAAARRAARRAGASPVGRAAGRAGAAAGRGAASAGKTMGAAASRAARRARDAARRKLNAAKNGGGAETTRHVDPPSPRRVGATIGGGPGTTAPGGTKPPTNPPSIKPPPLPARRKEPAMATGNPKTGPHQGASVMYEAARQFQGVCATYQHKGNLEVRAEAYEFAATLGLLADALAMRAEANSKENLDPGLHAMYRNAAAAIHAIAQSTRDMGPAFDAMHKQLVENLLTGANPASWDTTRNGRG